MAAECHARLGQPGSPEREHLFVERLLAKQAVSVFQDSFELNSSPPVCGGQLVTDTIDGGAAFLGGVFDDAQVVWREHHARDYPGDLRDPLPGLAVDLVRASSSARRVHDDVENSTVSLGPQLKSGFVRSPPDNVAPGRSPERLGRGEKLDAFDDVGLAGRVRPDKNRQFWSRLELESPVAAEIGEFEMCDEKAHARLAGTDRHEDVEESLFRDTL